ncbi:MAG: DUF2262 domain-containing protein [Phycisphaerales bacterium]|nr:DUF2262 domain-containing protein [Phycisphaerales bacterium]
MTREPDFESDLDQFRVSWNDRVMQSPVLNLHAIAASDATTLTQTHEMTRNRVFTVYAYRDRDNQDSPVVVQNLVVEMLLEVDGLEPNYTIQPYQVIHFRARISEITPGVLRGKIEEIVNTSVQDKRLESIAEELKKPLVIRDADLGNLELDRQLGCFEGRIRYRWRRVAIMIHAASADCLAQHLPAFKSLLSKLKLIDSNARVRVCDELQETYNSNWREPPSPTLQGDALGRKIRLSMIEFHPGDRLTLYYDARDLFWGHEIEVRCESDGSVFEVCLSG